MAKQTLSCGPLDPGKSLFYQRTDECFFTISSYVTYNEYTNNPYDYRYRRVQGSNPGKPGFFKAFFINCISYVFNCDDLLSIYIFNLYGYVVLFFFE